MLRGALQLLFAFAAISSVRTAMSASELATAKAEWKALLAERPRLGPALERLKGEIDPFFAKYDEDLDGPLDEKSMQNEFGGFDEATWRKFMLAKGITPKRAASSKQATLAPVHDTPRARLDVRGGGETRRRAQCSEWDHLLVSHVALHNRILDFSNDMPAAERKVLVFGNIPHGLGNRLGAYISYFLLCVVTRRACLLDDSQVVAPMGELFEALPIGQQAWDWRWSEAIGKKLAAAGIAKTNFHMTRAIFSDATPESAFRDAATGRQVQWAALDSSYDGNVFRSTQLVHAAFNVSPQEGDGVNEHYAKVLRAAGVRTPPTWMTAGCLGRVLFQPRQLMLDQLSPLLDAFEQHRFVVGIHIRLGFLVSGAGADGRVRLNTKVTEQIAKFAAEEKAGRAAVPERPWEPVDDWIRRSAVKHPHAHRPKFGNLLADTFRCAEFLASQAVDAGLATEPLFFVATDAKPIEDLVNAVYGAPGSKVKVLTTPYQPKHSGNAGSKFERLKLAMDWQLLAMADQLVSVGSIQSTFSASAWHFSLLADQLKHINDQGQCVRGGGSLFKLHSDYHQDDPTLKKVLGSKFVVLPKYDHPELR